MKKIVICNIPVNALTMRQTLDIIHNAIALKKPIHHVVVNAAKVVNAQKDRALMDSIVSCDLVNADGQAVVWASRILGDPLPERVAGIDLMENLVASAPEKGYRIFFFGAREEVVKKVINRYSALYGPGIIAGYRNGYYKKEEEGTIARQIAGSGADILFVAMTSPKKEIFLETHKNVIRTPFIMGVGGSFDVVSGSVRRAPVWMQRYGLEWFFRTLQEPGRMWKRYFHTNTVFIYLVTREKLRQLF
jgi:N-acetylglucosaminyldiphosphoundecaprenol N-acetyl-beta-D-mannosaminyltransferase